jgi:penicillin amidase
LSRTSGKISASDDSAFGGEKISGGLLEKQPGVHLYSWQWKLRSFRLSFQSMSNAFARFGRLLLYVVLALMLLIAASGIWFHQQLRGSLPQLDGGQAIAGLSATVTVTRDALGVPSVRGANREDVARALGFLHAQDRFFQMDLLRRRAAGELAELFGEVALPLDRATRPHHFRSIAQKVANSLPLDHRRILEAYTVGVNTGLDALKVKPFEYILGRAEPSPWKVEDSVLIVYAMILDLQDSTNNYELSMATVRDQLGMQALAFFVPLLTPNDASLDGSTGPIASVPGPELINLRSNAITAATPARAPVIDQTSGRGEYKPGSNSFALSAAHTASGAAMLANDPHLNLSVPNIWYRAVLEWPAATEDTTSHNRVVGVSLPGLPFIVLGSNGHVAWGLTHALVDTNDLVAVDVNPVSKSLYKAPGQDDLLTIENRSDTINVKGSEPVVVETEWTHWGPIVARDFRDRPLAHRWVAHDPAATNLNFIQLESAKNVTEAVAIAHNSGIPPHNFLVADRAGDIAWTIAGKYPKRVGYDGRLPVSWTFGDRYWDGFVPPNEVPVASTATRATNPNATTDPLSERAISGRLWTANNRLIGHPGLSLLGDGGYAPAARAAQVRDRLLELNKASPQDFLNIMRDDRGLFLDPWQKLLISILTPERVGEKRSRAELLSLVQPWEGRASIDSVSYRLVRAFRSATSDLALTPVFARCVEAMPAFDWRQFDFEPALWSMIEQKPVHLLAPKYESWDALLLAAVDETVKRIEEEAGSLKEATWGKRNMARIAHPLGRALPFGLGDLLNMPKDSLPGDIHMPLIQNPSFGASTRMVVSPGREEEGIFQMSGGQSGHPLSEFYKAGHSAWVHGEPTPLMPGETKHTLELKPEPSSSSTAALP